MLSHTSTPTATTTQRLRYRLNFGEADLKANHEGLLSAKQRRNLLLKFLWQYIYLGYVIIFFGSCSLIMDVMSHGYSSREHPGAWLAVGGFFLLAMLPLVLINQYNIYCDLRIDRVLRHKDTIYPQSTPWQTQGRSLKPAEYWLTVHTDKEPYIRIDLTRSVFEAFVPGNVYILYYTPKSKTLVAVEHLPEESLPPGGIPESVMATRKRMTRRERRLARQNAE